ncbi:MAG: helix-turn-helix transcriptional regulator [Myxococcales bacterium]|nr:helix-turn-helix transcriptional regulator [Myxococcales bacterium]MBK7192252.1 helix-turn-helix transcriptional regulator [Myxococcales bacterium]
MLFAASQTDFAGAQVRSALFFDRTVRMHVMDKRRLLFDSRFAPPSPVVRDVVTVYALAAGMLTTGEVTVATRGLWVMAETELERPTRGAHWFRSWGERSVAVELRLARALVKGPIGLAAGPRPLAPTTWAAVDALIALAGTPAAGVAPLPPVQAALAGLVADGVLAAPPTLTLDEPPALTRLWQAITPAYDAYATAITIDQVAATSGRSSRQVRRELKAMAKEFDLFGGDFRQITRILRLRAALLLLSAPDASVAEVADRVGYGSPVAMARAFRDADLPAPSELRAIVRYPG